MLNRHSSNTAAFIKYLYHYLGEPAALGQRWTD
jgi:hypothetical protein